MQDFAEFFDSQGSNPMLNFAAHRLGVARSRDRLSEVIAALGSFWMVGTTQTIDLLSPKLFAALGIADTKPRRANTSGADFPKVLSLTSEITDLVHQRDTEDLALFEGCKQMESATLARFGLSPTSDLAPDT